jgi:hypothetical protein
MKKKGNDVGKQIRENAEEISIKYEFDKKKDTNSNRINLVRKEYKKLFTYFQQCKFKRCEFV